MFPRFPDGWLAFRNAVRCRDDWKELVEWDDGRQYDVGIAKAANLLKTCATMDEDTFVHEAYAAMLAARRHG